MSKIFWDTNLFIYLIEGEGERTEQVISLRQRMLERNDMLLTSSLTLGEVLVKPVESQDQGLVHRYKQAIETTANILPFDNETALRFAEIRNDRSIRPPDAIQLACASIAGTDLFITNDERLSRKNIPGIHFIQALQQVAL